MNKTIRRHLKIRDTLIKVRTIMIDIYNRGGFIPFNIELIESAIEEINSIFADEETIKDKNLYESLELLLQSYKRLIKNYYKIKKDN